MDIASLPGPQLAEILPLLHDELGIGLLEHRQHQIDEQLLGGRAEMDPTHA